MLKKMRWRFTAAAMSAFLAVILLLVCAVNLWNYNISADRLDRTLENLIRLDEKPHGEPPADAGDFPIPGPFGGHSGEARFMTRFFVVYCDENGSITDINQENIASVSAEEAESYAREILKKGRESGYYKNYRYRIRSADSGTILAFLNSEREIQFIKTLLLVSGIIAILSMLAVFLLVLILSKRAIAPYVRNLEAQKQFITDAGHELKTPLTSISASADILAMEYEDNEWVKNIQGQSARMSKLVKGLVQLSRLDEEQSFTERTDFSLSEAIWEISEPAAAVALAAGKEYSQNIEEGMIFCGDRNTIQQMISVLLDNAVRYSAEKGKISLDAHRRRKKIIIEVRNTIRPSESIDTQRIFDRFYRSDKSRSDSEGFGIGLSAAKAAAERHKGTIRAELSDNGEIVFTVIL